MKTRPLRTLLLRALNERAGDDGHDLSPPALFIIRNVEGIVLRSMYETIYDMDTTMVLTVQEMVYEDPRG